MLTSVPVLCFGLLAWPASLLIRRIGIDRAVVVTLLGAAAGIVVRSVGGSAGAVHRHGRHRGVPDRRQHRRPPGHRPGLRPPTSAR
jgi:hypothetical protein